MTTNKLDFTLDEIFKLTNLGHRSTSIGDVIYGIDHRSHPLGVPDYQDSNGLIFFTKPQLNLTDDNIRIDRKFIPLLTKIPHSIQRIIRSYLDPRIYNDRQSDCPLVDTKNAFIPILSTHLRTLSGWPDPVVDLFISKPGNYKETFGFTNSSIDRYQNFTLSSNFRNMKGNLIPTMFDIWLNYQTCVYEGKMSPYPDFKIENTIDYNTRIFRLVLDKTKNFVTGIASTIAIPISVPLGGMFDYQHDKNVRDNNNEISINFSCFGWTYNDNILFHEFNKTVEIFNTDMKDKNRSSTMTKIPSKYLSYFNYSGYPRIDTTTFILEWYIDTVTYTKVITRRNELNKLLNINDNRGI